MDANGPSSVPDRSGRNSFWTTARMAARHDAPDSEPASSQAPSAGALDGVRLVFWQTYRHLFPPHSLAAQTRNGNVVISWSVMDDPHAHYPYAAPVLLRFDEALLDAMWRADPRTRIRLAQKHEATLREGLRGYDPFVRFPNARVVNIG